MHLACPQLAKTEIARRLGVSNGLINYHLRGTAKCLRPEDAPAWEKPLVTVCRALVANQEPEALARLAELQRVLTPARPLRHAA